MTPWTRLALVAALCAVFIYVGAQAVGAFDTLIVAFATNVVAAPFGQVLTRWIETGSSSPNLGQSSSAAVAAGSHQRSQTEAVTAIVVAGASVYAMLFTVMALATQLAGLDQIEHAKMLSFSDLGYLEVQKYLAGTLFLCIGFPAITAACVALGASNRRLPFRVFAIGIAISLPVYFLAANAIGLESGLGDATQPSTALGGQLPAVPNYSGFETTAQLIQYAMLLAFAFGLSIYAWVIATLSRGTKRLVQWIFRAWTPSQMPHSIHEPSKK